MFYLLVAIPKNNVCMPLAINSSIW